MLLVLCQTFSIIFFSSYQYPVELELESNSCLSRDNFDGANLGQ